MLKQDEEKAKNCFKKAAKLGNGWGMFEYAEYYEENEINSWHKKSFESNDNYAKGMCYFSGRFVRHDNNEAFKWLLKSAEENNMYGQYQVGYCYYYGNDVEMNDEEAFKWYLKSAQQGYGLSQYLVGGMLQNGEGIDKNILLSWKWYKKAAKQGDEDSIDSLKDEIFNNIVEHENTRKGLLCLISIHKYRKNENEKFGIIPFDVIKLIIKEIWKTKNEECWKFGEDNI